MFIHHWVFRVQQSAKAIQRLKVKYHVINKWTTTQYKRRMTNRWGKISQIWLIFITDGNVGYPEKNELKDKSDDWRSKQKNKEIRNLSHKMRTQFDGCFFDRIFFSCINTFCDEISLIQLLIGEYKRGGCLMERERD